MTNVKSMRNFSHVHHLHIWCIQEEHLDCHYKLSLVKIHVLIITSQPGFLPGDGMYMAEDGSSNKIMTLEGSESTQKWLEKQHNNDLHCSNVYRCPYLNLRKKETPQVESQWVLVKFRFSKVFAKICGRGRRYSYIILSSLHMVIKRVSILVCYWLSNSLKHCPRIFLNQ